MAGRIAISRAARDHEIILPAALRSIPTYTRPKTLNHGKRHESFPRAILNIT